MERLADLQAAAAAHKRKGSAVELLDGFDPSSAKAPRPPAEEQQPEEGEPAPELTELCQLHLVQLRTQQEELVRHVDDITAAGLAFLDSMRAAFQDRMSKVKAELGVMVDQAEESLRVQSASTLDFRRRAAMAAELVAKLNIRAVDVERRPETLFSTEQEPAAGSEEGAAQ